MFVCNVNIRLQDYVVLQTQSEVEKLLLARSTTYDETILCISRLAWFLRLSVCWDCVCNSLQHTLILCMHVCVFCRLWWSMPSLS
jgi:hypothetical protein